MRSEADCFGPTAGEVDLNSVKIIPPRLPSLREMQERKTKLRICSYKICCLLCAKLHKIWKKYGEGGSADKTYGK